MFALTIRSIDTFQLFIKTLKKTQSQSLKKVNYLINQDDNFIAVATQKKRQYLLILKNHLEEFKVFEQWIINLEMYEEAFDELIDNIKRQMLEKIKSDKIVLMLY